LARLTRTLPLLVALSACIPRDQRPYRNAITAYDVPHARLFERWLAEDPARGPAYERFQRSLADAGVARVVPAWTLWRQGTDYATLAQAPFAMPPEDEWGAIVPTLVVVRDEVVPLVGPVDCVSGYRTAAYNVAADGAPGSRHRWFEAVDLVPVESWLRPDLHATLLDWWTTRGAQLTLGLGLYDQIRFHVDTWKYRKW
jgi:hypothetical protein